MINKRHCLNDNAYPWILYMLLPLVGIEEDIDNDALFIISPELLIFINEKKGIVIDFEKIKISTKYGYRLKLRTGKTYDRIFIIRYELTDNKIQYFIEPYHKSTTNAHSIWRNNFKGLIQWPK